MIGLGTRRHGPDLDANGFTNFGSLAGDATAVYVSNAGNDTTGAGTFANPYATRDKGMDIINGLTTGRPHRLLFKAGDTFTITFLKRLTINGRSQREPVLVSSYDASNNVPAQSGARPLFKCVNDVGGVFRSSNVSPNADFVAYVGLEFYAYTQDPDSPDFVDASVDGPKGITYLSAPEFVMIEDCKFSFMGYAFDVESTKIVIARRNIIHNNYSGGAGHSQGLFANKFSYCLLEENFLYHNGFNATATGADATQFNHNIYTDGDDWVGNDDNGQKAGRVEAVGNVTMSASANGMQLRPGARMADNFFCDNPVTGWMAAKPSTIEYNVVLQGISAGGIANAWGPEFNCGGVSGLIRNNIIANAVSGTADFGIWVRAGTGVAVNNNIVWDWGATPLDNDGTGTTQSGNDFTETGPYPATASATIQAYDTSIGGPGTLAHFVGLGIARAARTWTANITANAVNNYVRVTCFGQASYTSAPNFKGT